MKLSFTVPGQPVAKARTRHAPLKECLKCHKKTVARICRCGSESFNYITTIPMTDQKTEMYENLVAMCAREAMQTAGVTELLSGPLSLEAVFSFAIPASRMKKVKDGNPHTQRPDLDNCEKAVMDALNKNLYADDSQICVKRTAKIWADLPQALITIESYA